MKKIVLPLLWLGLLAAVGASESHLRQSPLLPDKASPKVARNKGEDKKDSPAKKKRKPHFTIGKETTYITEPLDADGYIDYATALNERLRRGVTPANNANVLLWKALGPHPDGAKMTAEFFKWMGIAAPPERGDYFIPLSRYVKEHLKVDPRKEGNAIYNESQFCSQRPWTAKQHPNIAAWLKVNEKPLAIVLEASRRTHYFSPLLPTKTDKGSSGFIGALLPSVQKCRELANALTARAMLRIGEGRIDEAWQDLLVCHRLGRLVARGPSLIEALVGFAIDSVASGGDLVFLDKTELKAERIMACLGDLQKLPPMPLMADKVDLCERFACLDVVMIVDRGGPEALGGDILSGDTPPKTPSLMSKLFLVVVDWDPALRNANRWFDRMAKAMRAKDRDTREKQLDQIGEKLEELNKKSSESMPNVFQILSGKALGEKIGNIAIGLLVPAIQKVQNAADRSEQVQNNLYLAFALAAYRRDRGHYPKELNALAPKYLAKIPQDMFSGEALIYRQVENGYLLYSIGVNGRDEQGRTSHDDPPGDDLAVHMPLPKLPQK